MRLFSYIIRPDGSDFEASLFINGKEVAYTNDLVSKDAAQSWVKYVWLLYKKYPR